MIRLVSKGEAVAKYLIAVCVVTMSAYSQNAYPFEVIDPASRTCIQEVYHKLGINLYTKW